VTCVGFFARIFVLATLMWPVLAAPATVDYNRDIRKILSENCFKCHGPDEAERKGGSKNHRLRLDTPDSYQAIVPGSPEKSEVVKRITSTDADEKMPPVKSGKKLSAQEIALIQQWIKQGAKYSTHWAYTKPARPEVPAVKNKRWAKNEIDRFILARLEREKLRPSVEADRNALIRRVSLDLIGLPPSPEEVASFVKDTNPTAFEDLVDRLLAKQAFGEHWARFWLDQARYADSAGYADDPARTIWAYRDWVIRAFNQNKRFDQFTIEQLAGDLLDEPTEDQLIATGFHRNTMTNNEGGTADEEFRNVAVIDRVNTTFAVWMGTTMGCAQCHTHKYDPITNEEYFKTFAIFNNTEDADRTDESPFFTIWTKEQKATRAQLEKEIAEADATWKQAAFQSQFTECFEPVIPRITFAQTKVLALQKKYNRIKPVTTTPIFRELSANKRRKTNMQIRGNYLNLGKEVEPGIPAAFNPPPEKNPNRLTFARWLVSAENPLTARVTVNRLWEAIFGIGIVRTSEDFGLQGDAPTHRELLDWLATEFVASGWDVKHILKLMVTSATYRQSSRVTPELLARDPDNLLLARGPRFRLSAETIRDQAMAVSGLLSPKMFGPPVKPPQPNLGLKAAFGSATDWETSAGEDKYRRAIYTTWRRSNPYPSMATFDAPNREVCTIRRDRSNTPLQALVTLNDPVYIEAAQHLAQRMAEVAYTPKFQIQKGFELCLDREASSAELNKLVALYEKSLDSFSKDESASKKFASASNPSLASLTVVANVLLNLDETLMKR
jgi:mono/diheme cytochrome c family protein